MATETREVALKMVSEAPNKSETTAEEVNLMDSEAGATEGGWGELVIPYVVAEATKVNSKFRDKYKTTAKVPTSAEPATTAAAPSSATDFSINILSYDSSSRIEEKNKYWSDMILRNKFMKDITEDGWLVTCILCSQEKGGKRGIINIYCLFSLYNWNSHCLCDHHLNAVTNIIAEEETGGKNNKNRNSQMGLATFFAKRSDKNQDDQLLQRLLHFLLGASTNL